MAKTEQLKRVNIATLSDDIDKAINKALDKYHIDIYDIEQVKRTPTNIFSNIFYMAYSELFKPNTTSWCNKNSIIDYDNIEELSIVVNKYLEWCNIFNKSLGVSVFSLFTGVSVDSLIRWSNDEANSTRCNLIKKIYANKQRLHLGILSDTPVGALAMANNDSETGLKWQAQQQATTTRNNVYFIPSERVDKLRLELQETPTE